MGSIKRWAACGGLIFICTAQTPAPSPAPIVALPLKTARHLEYRFHVTYQRSGELHDSGMSDGGTGGNGSGIVSTFGGGGREGVMTVDVVAAASDGALVVKVAENVQSAARPGETYTCVVYGDGRMTCQGLARTADPGIRLGISDAESVLVSLMGRGFIDPSRMDAKNHWQHGYSDDRATLQVDYTMSPSGDGKLVTVSEHSHFQPHTQRVAEVLEDAVITYDTAMSVPDRIHDEKHESMGNGLIQTIMDIDLTKDSFAVSP